MSLIALANSLFIALWMAIIYSTYNNKKGLSILVKYLWIPISLGIIHFIVLFIQKGQFPITNLKQFSFALLFLAFILLALFSKKKLEIGAYCFSLYVPIYFISILGINENYTFLSDFSSYSQVLLIIHIGFVLIGQLLFTTSFLLACLMMRQFLKKEYYFIFNWLNWIVIGSLFILLIAQKYYFLLIFFILFILLLKFLPKSFIIKEERLLLYARKIVTLGLFFFFTGAIIFGMIWANIAWGRFWAWDPKETWALITLLTYSIFIHWQPKANTLIKSSLFLMLAFLLLMFNFIYINFFVEGLHSYAFGTQMFFTNV